MSYHVIDISTSGAQVSVKDEQLICRLPDGSMRKLPMEDVGAVLVNSFSANLHSSFLISAARYRVAVIVCDRFKPVSMVLPVQRATDTMLTRAQIEAPARLLREMWIKTVDAKCQNQYELLERAAPDDVKALRDFAITLNRSDASKEGNCARLYWGALSRSLKINGFRRHRMGDGLNSLLNYGYAVLLMRIEQKLLACGLDPLYGMGHCPRERSMPLAYDIMEPFRPFVDEMIIRWIKNIDSECFADVMSVDASYKQYIQKMMLSKHRQGRATLTLDMIVERSIRTFRLALTQGKGGRYQPWIRRNSRWVG